MRQASITDYLRPAQAPAHIGLPPLPRTKAATTTGSSQPEPTTRRTPQLSHTQRMHDLLHTATAALLQALQLLAHNHTLPPQPYRGTNELSSHSHEPDQPPTEASPIPTSQPSTCTNDLNYALDEAVHADTTMPDDMHEPDRHTTLLTTLTMPLRLPTLPRNQLRLCITGTQRAFLIRYGL